ncbi:nucleoside diphosphate kinase [Monosporozyma servazzii]
MSQRLNQSFKQLTMSEERTFIAVKPDGVQRGLVSNIIGRFEQRGYKLVGIKLVQASQELLAQHYAEHVGKPFYPKMASFMASGPIVAMCWEGKNVVKQGRVMLGATNPADSAPGTIRGDFGIDLGRNICHGSDSVEAATREIGLWFKPEELINWESNSAKWIYE